MKATLDMYTPAIGHHVYRIDAWDKTTNITSGSFNMMYISRVEKGLKLIDISPSRNVNTYGGAVTREPHERLKHWGRPRASYVS
jgi:hypothetical protein